MILKCLTGKSRVYAHLRYFGNESSHIVSLKAGQYLPRISADTKFERTERRTDNVKAIYSPFWFHLRGIKSFCMNFFIRCLSFFCDEAYQIQNLIELCHNNNNLLRSIIHGCFVYHPFCGTIHSYAFNYL